MSNNITVPHEYIPALDGLRAVSILLVFLSHAWLGDIVPGGLGVTIFFFISGFIITHLMIQEYNKEFKISLKRFYLKRFFRLAPALFVYIIVAQLVWLGFGGDFNFSEVLPVLFYYANYYAIYVGFDGSPFASPYNIIWSLSVEEHYYILFPLFFSIFYVKKLKFLYIILFLLVFGLVWRLYLISFVGLDSIRIYAATDTRFDSILYGALYAFVFNCCDKMKKYTATNYSFFAGVIIIFVTLLVRNDFFRETVRYSLQGLGLFLLFYNIIFSNGIVAKVLSSPVLVYIGRISYSLYLYHWLVFGVVSFLFKNEPWIIRFAILLIFSVAISHFSYKYIESIGPNIRRRFNM